MKKIIITLAIGLISLISYAQNETPKISVVSPDTAIVYRLFSTNNTFNFIKLNTRNGKLWQIQWNTGKNKFETPISLMPLVSKEEERNGRFFLYQSHNIYNFLLLDQIDGRVWQVQWGINEEDRQIIRIY